MTHGWRGALGLLAVWLAATLLAHGLGLGLHADCGRTWQLLDLPWLHDDLARSLWYQHGQPPGFNLAVGVLAKAGVGPDSAAMHGLFDLLGLLVGLGAWRLALALGAASHWAWLAAALLLASPGSQLYQHWMFYDEPVTLGVVVSLLALRQAARGSRWACGMLAVALASLVWLRSVWHVAWLCGLAAAVLVPADARALPRRRLAAALAMALLVGALPYVKNAWVFGHFEASSWAGMSAQRLTHQFIPLAERQRLHAQGRIDAVSVVGPYRPLHEYAQPPLAASGVPALDQPAKHTGHPNFNHLRYADISRRMLRDAGTLVAAHPDAYAQAHLSAWLHWLRPASAHPNLAKGRQVLRPWLEPWNRWLLGEAAGLHVVLALGALLGWVALLRLSATRQGKAAGLDAAQRAMVRGAAWTALWLTLLGNLLEHGENYRFRAYLDPLLLAVLALLATEAARRFKDRAVAVAVGQDDGAMRS